MDGKEFTSREEELEFLGGGKYFFHAETGATRFFIVHALPRDRILFMPGHGEATLFLHRILPKSHFPPFIIGSFKPFFLLIHGRGSPLILTWVTYITINGRSGLFLLYSMHVPHS